MRRVVIECVDKKYIKDYLDYELEVRTSNMYEMKYGSMNDFDYDRYDKLELIALNDHWYLTDMSVDEVGDLYLDGWSSDIGDCHGAWNNDELVSYIQGKKKRIPFKYQIIEIGGGR